MFKFVLVNYKLHPKIQKYKKGWFLLIECMDILLKFLEIRGNGLFSQYMELKKKVLRNKPFHFKDKAELVISMALEMNNDRKTIVDDIAVINKTFLDSYNRIFRDYGKVYISKQFSVRPFNDNDDICILDIKFNEECKFPSYTEYDINVTQWVDGKHYYAKIGALEVHDDNGNIKWATYDKAYSMARNFLKGL